MCTSSPLFYVWLPDGRDQPPILALIHASTTAEAGIFLVACLLPLFIVIPY
uniref:NADH-plastoquinone oxidoreductase subunit 5 n=1 Tax=Cymbaria mongolica TaxID=374685 RepID=UPI0022772973|nr:NADH-plastoquinone oxidoreductase subunit 5 [Cymbaria mongolica]UYS85104.1 NADH-plastoquinone oxidoreductase subunit 5 [Cymbaria mongolica]